MKELPEKEVLAQLEEAYARATVALTRAQKLCIIMGPLDMRGLLGAARVILSQIWCRRVWGACQQPGCLIFVGACHTFFLRRHHKELDKTHHFKPMNYTL